MKLTQKLTARAIELRKAADSANIGLSTAIELRNTADLLLSTVNTIEKLVKAIRKSEREYVNMDEDAPLDPGCLQCTDGTTPPRYDTGACAHHQRLAVLAEFGGLH